MDTSRLRSLVTELLFLALPLLSFSLPSVRDDLSSDGVHTFAAIEGAEGYELFKEGFEPVLCEINNLIHTWSVEIDGKTYPLTIYFGGDYKVLL